MDRSYLAKRMKRYEEVSRNFLVRRVPAIMRLDGRAFHTFTKGFVTPFDDNYLLEAMRQTMVYLCENIQGCVFGYTQSDEITLILTDYKTIHTEPWFEYNVQKMVSNAASMATLKFNQVFSLLVSNILTDGYITDEKQIARYTKASQTGAYFDCRVFNIPLDDVCNNIVWRQADCTRNSIQSVGQHYFSPKELHLKDNNQIQDMLMRGYNINWNDFPVHLKRGSACIKSDVIKHVFVKGKEESIKAAQWVVDKNMPILTQNRDYVESRVFIKED